MARLRFAIVVENDVAGVIEIDEGYNETGDRMIAAFKSDAKIIETFDQNVQFGWTFDGTIFNSPEA